MLIISIKQHLPKITGNREQERQCDEDSAFEELAREKDFFTAGCLAVACIILHPNISGIPFVKKIIFVKWHAKKFVAAFGLKSPRRTHPTFSTTIFILSSKQQKIYDIQMHNTAMQINNNVRFIFSLRIVSLNL